MYEKQLESIAEVLTQPSLPLYNTLLRKRPLPTSLRRATVTRRSEHEDVEVSDHHFEEAQELSEDDSSSEEDTDQENTKRSGSTKIKSLSSRKVTALSSRKPSNQEPGRHEMAPRGTKNSTSGRAAREAEEKKKKKRAPPKRREADSESEEEEDQEQDQDQENKRLKIEVFRLQKATQLASGSKSKGGKNAQPGTESAEARETLSQTKMWLWKQVKFISNDVQCARATKLVMQKMDLRSLKGLTGRDLVNAEETWIAMSMDTVRKGLNYWRNYVQQELHKLMFKEVWATGSAHDPDSVPDIKQILQLALAMG